MATIKTAELLSCYLESHDPALLDELISRYRSMARGMAQSLVPCARGYWREEVDAFALDAVWQALKTYDPAQGARFKTYLSHMVRYTILNGWRSLLGTSRKHTMLSMTALVASMEKEALHGHLVLDNLHHTELTVEDRLTRKELMAELMLHLTPKDRRLLSQLYEDGMKQAEIAEAEGVSRATISLRKQKLLKRLRRFVPREWKSLWDRRTEEHLCQDGTYGSVEK